MCNADCAQWRNLNLNARQMMIEYVCRPWLVFTQLLLFLSFFQYKVVIVSINIECRCALLLFFVLPLTFNWSLYCEYSISCSTVVVAPTENTDRSILKFNTNPTHISYVLYAEWNRNTRITCSNISFKVSDTVKNQYFYSTMILNGELRFYCVVWITSHESRFITNMVT